MGGSCKPRNCLFLRRVRGEFGTGRIDRCVVFCHSPVYAVRSQHDPVRAFLCQLAGCLKYTRRGDENNTRRTSHRESVHCKLPTPSTSAESTRQLASTYHSDRAGPRARSYPGCGASRHLARKLDLRILRWLISTEDGDVSTLDHTAYDMHASGWRSGRLGRRARACASTSRGCVEVLCCFAATVGSTRTALLSAWDVRLAARRDAGRLIRVTQFRQGL